MKKLVALIAVLGFIPAAHAAEGAEFTQSGEFRLQYQDNVNMSGSKDAPMNGTSNDATWHQRLKWGVNARAGEKMNAHLSLVHNANWGANATQVPGNVDVAAAPGTADTSNLLIVNEAYANWVINDSWMMKFGRGSVTMADGRFVSANEFENVATAFDGALLAWDQDWGRTHFFAVEGAKDATNHGNVGRFYGVSEDLKSLPAWLKTAHVHVVQAITDEGTYEGTAAPYNNETRAGLSVGGDMMGIDYRADYEMESGKYRVNGGTTNETVSTSMIDAEVGYTMASLMNGRVHVLYHTDSGTSGGVNGTNTDKTYNSFYYDQHNNGGLMDIFKWGNLTYMNIGLSAQPKDDITVALDYYMFSKTQKDDVVNAKAQGSAFAVAGAGAANDAQKADLGSEIDLSVNKKYSNNFNINARYGMFTPGSNYKDSTSDLKDMYSQYYVEGKLTF